MRVMVLTSATGGGHNMRARSLLQWAMQERPGWRVEIHPVLESTHGLYHFGVELYNLIQKTWPRLHHVYFNYLEMAGMFRDPEAILGRQSFIEVLEEKRPELIVSVHGSTNHGFFDIARSVLGRKRVRCVTYCAEMYGGYGMSKHWVNPDADLFIGSVAETGQTAVALGMPEDRIKIGGFLLNPSFYEADLGNHAEKVATFWRDIVRLDPARTTLILSTGANSANNHRRFLKSLRSLGRPLQVIALCGQSEKTHREVEALAEKLRDDGLTIRALSTTNQMALLMRSASAIVARPGSGTTNEAIQSECPLIFNRLGGLMPQEMITERYGQTHGLSESIARSSALNTVLRSWIDQPERRLAIVERMRLLKPSQHPTDILTMLEDVWN